MLPPLPHFIGLLVGVLAPLLLLLLPISMLFVTLTALMPLWGGSGYLLRGTGCRAGEAMLPLSAVVSSPAVEVVLVAVVEVEVVMVERGRGLRFIRRLRRPLLPAPALVPRAYR